jgi:hypothetical protein
MMHVYSSPKKKKFGQNMILVMNHVLCMGLKQNINENFRKKKIPT